MPLKNATSYLFVIVACVLSIFITACKPTHKNALFTKLDANISGIHFSNDIHEDDSTRSFINEFGYMGGGVAIGDFNNDGLKDIFFSGNQVSCRLYINKGNNTFEDITEKAGLGTDTWATGISIVDINGDGFDDIYVCTFGKDLQHRAKNLLFINQKNLTFKEQAAEYGLADTGYSSQAVFFDYDKDGDLDMYLTHYMLNGPNANSIYPKDKSGRSPANDRLFRNDGDINKLGHPHFTDVTLAAGIKEDGFGLGVVASDFNNDGWPDIYVANDFVSNDELWLNNKNGTFTNCIASSTRHQSYSSMGADAADINNDKLPDIVTLDMLPENNERKKINPSMMNYNRYEMERSMGYEPEYMRNMLQLNNGNYQKDSSPIPFFSEIGQLAGIPATDWSWSVLLADFDNDGWKDMHITNGIGRDFINADFLEFSNGVFAKTADKKEQRKLIMERLMALKHIDLPNYLYLNNHDLTFTDASEKAGINELSMSNGAAYVDLDNDGDLDLVVNNINKEAFVFINNTISPHKLIINHSIRINLKGNMGNNHGFGTKVYVYTNGQVQLQEENPVRGYFSSVDQALVFGLGKNSMVDSIVTIWPNDKRQVMTHVKADSSYTVLQTNATLLPIQDVPKATVFIEAATETNILYKHTDVPFNDYDVQRLLPQKYSQLGPYIATGDINKDGLTDFFVGGAFNFSGKIFVQQKNGSFLSHNLSDSIKMQEDMESVFFDADGDGNLDLLVTCGDTRYPDSSPYLQPRLYMNDGKGNFFLRANAFPPNVTAIAGCITVGDFDGDGDADVFIGGRVSEQYPLSPRSFILQNNKGYFTDVTASVCPALQRPGMVTSATWVDYDNDHQLDLVIAGDWMPIRFFKNNHGKLQEATAQTGLVNNSGMWRSLVAVDIDGDGDMDFVAGNLGSNCLYHSDSTYPMKLFATDIDGNGSIDPLFFYHILNNDGKRVLLPAINRGQLSEQVPSFKKKFLRHNDYAKAGFDDIFDSKAKEKMMTLTCNETKTCYFENMGHGKFLKHILPQEAQFAPVNSILCADFDHDGITDILLGGNEYQAEVMTGRYDASYGCLLKGKSGGGFETVPFAKTGLRLQGDVKNLALLPTLKEKLLVVAVNNDSMQVFKIKH